MADVATTVGTRKILVIVPAFNEAERIAGTLADLREHAPWADVLVVDDGSLDGTAETARAAGASAVRHPFNLGVGGAMQTGYLYASENRYDVAFQFDGDGQHCAESMAGMLEPIARGEADLVIGSRVLGDPSYRFSAFRWLGSRILMAMLRLLTGLKVTDPTSGFRAASGRLCDFFALYYPQSYLGDTVEALAAASWHGMKVAEVPARMRMSRRSSVSNFVGMIHMLRISLALIVDRIERRFPMPKRR